MYQRFECQQENVEKASAMISGASPREQAWLLQLLGSDRSPNWIVKTKEQDIPDWPVLVQSEL